MDKCFLGIKQFESDSYIIRSLNHEIYLKLVQNSTLSEFDDEKCYESNIEKALRVIV